MKLRVPGSRSSPARELWRTRGLLRNLMVRELKIRYKSSSLGFVWTMATPVAMVLIFTFIFTRVFRSPLADFPVFFLAGFLPWQYFSNATLGAAGSIVANGDLIKKVYFPREILPLTQVLSHGLHFLLSFLVFGIYAVIQGYNFVPYLPILLVAFMLQAIFTSGLAMAVSGLNVRVRDLQELLPVIFLVWFYATPIIYSLEMVPPGMRVWLRLNPMVWFLELYRDLVYRLQLPSPRLIFVVIAASVISFLTGYLIFSRLSLSFAKQV